MSDAASFRFDVFLSHASEDKPHVRALARQLEAAGLSVWLDEEQLAPSFDPQTAIVRGLEDSRHVLIWVTEAWLGKTWTRWELELFAKAKSDARRVLPVLRVPWDDAVLGPYLTRQIAVPPERDEHERLWLVVCGVREQAPGERGSWAKRGRVLVGGAEGPSHSSADDQHAPPSGSVPARLEAAYQRREGLTISGADTTEVDGEILELRREQRRGPTLHPGEFLSEGRFRLIDIIGRGGFATVWKAYDRHERELVAIKVLHGRFAQDASRRERLFRGAKKMAAVQHPHVVRVLVPEGEEEGFYYCVMEYVAGGDLHRAIIDNRLDAERALTVVESIASALEVAHERDLVHRDVKPQNILLHESGAATLSDFDLVHAKDTTGGTRTGALGTVLYAAPEQHADASTVDHRADIYSLGMTAVFCVHGNKLPHAAMFQRDAFLAGLACTPALGAVLQRAVALQPEERFDSMAVFRAELAAVRCVPAQSEPVGEFEPTREPEPAEQQVVVQRERRAERDDRRSNAVEPASGQDERAWEERVLQELTTVFWDRDQAVMLAASAGFPRSRIPAFRTPLVFWTTVVGEARNGVLPGGIQPIIEKAAEIYPHNLVFARADSAPPLVRTSRGGVELVLIPGGTFLMGSLDGVGRANEHPQHEVELSSFYLAKTPVTNGQYGEYLKANLDVGKPRLWGDRRYNQPEQPVVGVSWEEAQAYCDWAGLVLPTEAQWECACRAGTTTRYSSGDGVEALVRVGWYSGNSGGRLHAVGEKEPNGFGLYDMHGNVWEWCMDNYGSYETRPRTGDGLEREPVGVADHVIRGGSWNLDADFARSAYRGGFPFDGRSRLVGFRPVLPHP